MDLSVSKTLFLSSCFLQCFVQLFEGHWPLFPNCVWRYIKDWVALLLLPVTCDSVTLLSMTLLHPTSQQTWPPLSRCEPVLG